MDDKKIEDHSHACEDFLFAQNADLRAQLVEKEKQIAAAVEFIRHMDREYSHYIADPGFERWRGPQEAGEVAHD